MRPLLRVAEMVTLPRHPVVDDQVAAAAVVPAEVVHVLLCCCLVLFVDHEWRVMV